MYIFSLLARSARRYLVFCSLVAKNALCFLLENSAPARISTLGTALCDSKDSVHSHAAGAPVPCGPIEKSAISCDGSDLGATTPLHTHIHAVSDVPHLARLLTRLVLRSQGKDGEGTT